VFGRETCGKAEEISFASSDNVTSFLIDVRAIILEEEKNEVTMCKFGLHVGWEDDLEIQILRVYGWLEGGVKNGGETCGSRLCGQRDGGETELSFACRLRAWIRSCVVLETPLFHKASGLNLFLRKVKRRFSKQPTGMGACPAH
jgi:hypothetical protein